jgi:hypothetical protein
MNPLCLEPETQDIAPFSSAASVPAQRPVVAAVRAIRPQSGLLACIESIARDRKMSVSQQALLQRFPRRCRRFQADEGRIDYRDALELMAELGVADSFETVREIPGLADLGDRVTRGVLLCVPDANGGQPRWWRLAGVKGGGIVAMQPEAEDPARFAEIAFAVLESAGAWAVVLD